MRARAPGHARSRHKQSRPRRARLARPCAAPARRGRRDGCVAPPPASSRPWKTCELAHQACCDSKQRLRVSCGAADARRRQVHLGCAPSYSRQRRSLSHVNLEAALQRYSQRRLRHSLGVLHAAAFASLGGGQHWWSPLAVTVTAGTTGKLRLAGKLRIAVQRRGWRPVRILDPSTHPPYGGRAGPSVCRRHAPPLRC